MDSLGCFLYFSIKQYFSVHPSLCTFVQVYCFMPYMHITDSSYWGEEKEEDGDGKGS